MPINEEEFKIYDPYDAYLNEVGDDQLKFNELNNKIRGLPRSLFDFIFDVLPADFIKDRISLALGLNENQSQETSKIVMEIILTDVYLGNVIQEIKNRLNIDEQKSKTIAGLIVTELFAPILEELKKIHVEKFAKNLPPQPQQQDDRIVNLKQSL